MKDLQDLKDIAKFLIEHQNEFKCDEMFGIIFPVIYNELSEMDCIDNIFIVFRDWWNKHADFRLINSDVNIANEFIKYYNGVYQLISHRNKIIEKWIKAGLIDSNCEITHGEDDFFKYLK